MDNKLNDWVLLALQNPEFTLDLYSNNGINTNNTSIYDRDRYMNSNLIQGMELFLTNGKFDKVKFNNFYDTALLNYNDLSSLTYAQTAMEQALFSYNNLAVSPEKRNKKVGWDIVKIQNPDRKNYGTERLGFISDPKFTPLEIALNEQVWNNKTQLWEDSPNDAWLTRDWTNPIAMATWDFDADANGNPTKDENAIVYHKGDYKIDPVTGTYYYETLDGKSPYGKDLLTPFDIITRDGSKANNYDFFDSDGLDKSFVGSVMKNAARIAPLFIPYVNSVYVAGNIALELGKVLPIIYKSTFGLAAGDNSFANKVEAIAMSFDNNRVSRTGQENFFNSESILNMVADVAKQLYEQRWIFTKAPRLFKPYSIEKDGALDKAISDKASEYIAKGLSPKTLAAYERLGKAESDIAAEAFAKASIWGAKYLEEYLQIGKIMSRLYMTGTSSYQAFSDAKELGASDLEAAAMFWGYFSGMYWLMGTEVGEHVLPELRLEKLQIKKMLQSVASLQTEAVRGLEVAAGKAAELVKLKNIFKRIFDLAANYGKAAAKQGTRPITEGFNSIWSNMLAEGVEEVSEEVLYDVTRATFDVIAKLSGSETRLSQWDTALLRYGQSFFGGMIGGGLFLASNDMKIRKRYDPGNVEANQELIYYIRNGKKAEIKRTLTDMYKNGAFGDPNLSTKMETVENGNVTYKAGTPEDNQNKAVYDLMNQCVDFIDDVLSTEKMHLPDDAIIGDDGISGKEVLQEIRYRNLMDPNNAVTVGTMLLDYNSMADRFLQLHSQLDDLNLMSDETKRNDPQWQMKVDDVNRRLNELRTERDKFFEPKSQAKYLGLLMFASNRFLSSPFANTTYRDFVESNYHKPVERLNEYEKQKSQDEYQEYLLHYANQYISKGYDVFINLLEKFSTTLQTLGETNYKNYTDTRNGLLSSTIQLTKPDGTVENISLLQLIPRFFGGVGSSDEKIQEIAESLKGKYNPFNEISNHLIKDGIKPDSLESAQQVFNILSTTANNLLQIIGQYGYIDGYTAKTVRELARLSTTIPGVRKGQGQAQLDLIMGDPEYNIINNALLELYRDINPSNALEKFNLFVLVLNQTNINDLFKSRLEQQVQQDIFGWYTPEVIDSYNRLMPLLNNVAESPISRFLADLKINENGLNIFDIINKAEGIFKAKNVTEFVIDGEISIEDVRNARAIVNQVGALVRATMYQNVGQSNPYGFTSMLNTIRSKYGADLLGILDTADASLMMLDLGVIASKLRFIERLHNMNQESSEREQNRLQARLNYLSWDLLCLDNAKFFKHADGSDKEINGEKVINDTIENIINNEMPLTRQMVEDLNSPVDISNDERATLEKERMLLENAIYDRIHELIAKQGNDAQLVLSVIFDGILEDLSTGNVTRDNEISINSQGITSRTDKFSVNNSIGYIMSFLGVRTGEFLTKYKQVVENDLSDIAPIPMLELCVKIQYGLSVNTDFYNEAAKFFGNEILKIMINGIPAFNMVLPNTVFASGVPGAGKSSAVARITHLMLLLDKNDLKVIVAAPNKNQAENLKNNISAPNATVMDKEQLLGRLGKTSADVNSGSDFEKVDQNGKMSLNLKNHTYPDGEKPDVMFIDEATHYTALELAEIADWCTNNGILLFLYGDPDQSGQRSEVTIDGFTVQNTMAACYCINTPKLTLSMRNTTNVKRDNGQYTQALSSEYDLLEFLASGEAVLDLWDGIKDKIVIKGSENNSAIYGDLLVDSLSELRIIDLISTLERGEKLGYIYDDPNTPTYQIMLRLKLDTRYAGQIEIKSAVEFFTEGLVLGNEDLYFIIDIDWDSKYKEPEGDDISDFLAYQNFVKSLHTTITRSKQGSFIIDRGSGLKLSQIVGDVFKTVPFNFVLKISMSDTSLANYKLNRLNQFNVILDGYTPMQPIPTPVQPQATGLPQALLQPAQQLGTPQGPAGTLQPVGQLGTNGLPQGQLLPVGLPLQQQLPQQLLPQQPATLLPSTGPQPLNIPEFDYATFDPDSTNFDDYLVGVYTVKQTTNSGQNIVEKIKNNGYITVARNYNIKSIANPQELKLELDNITSTSGTATYIIMVRKTETTLDNVTGFFGNARLINGNYIKGVVLKPGQQINPGQNRPINPQNRGFRLGYYKELNGKIYKIVEVGNGQYRVFSANDAAAGADEATQSQLIDATTFELEATNSNEQAFNDTVNALRIVANPITITGEDEAVERQSAVYVGGLTDEEFVNIVNNHRNGVGVSIKVYTAWGIRSGIALLRNRDESLKSPDGIHYAYDKAGDEPGIFGDLQFLLNIPYGSRGQIRIDLYNEAVRLLYNIRSKLLYTMTLNNANNILSGIVNQINEFRRKWNLPTINSFNGLFKLKTYGGNSYDRSVNQYRGAQDAKQNKVIVFNDGTNEITLGTIANESTVLNYINKLKIRLNDAVARGLIDLQEANDILLEWNDSLKTVIKIHDLCFSNLGILYFDLPANFYFGTDLKLTNTKNVSVAEDGHMAFTEEDRAIYDFEELKADPSLICSDPHILTGIMTQSAKLDSSMAGKVVSFITHDLNLIYWPSENARPQYVSNPNQLAELWMLVRNNVLTTNPQFKKYIEELKDKIKIVKLDPKGNTFLELIELEVKIKNEINATGNSTLASLGNINTGARLFEIFLNMESDILHYIKDNPNPLGEITIGSLKFASNQELKSFELNLRNLLLRIIKIVKHHLEGTTRNINLASRRFYQLINSYSEEIKRDLGLSSDDDFIDTLNDDVLTKIDTAFAKLFNLLQDRENLNLSWLEGGEYLAIGTTHSRRILSAINNFFTNNSNGVCHILTSKLEFLKQLSNLVSIYDNPKATQINGATNNFKGGIFMNVAYAQGQSGENRTATEMAYPAQYVRGTLTVNVVPQSADFIVNGNVIDIIGLAIDEQSNPRLPITPQPPVQLLQQGLSELQVRDYVTNFVNNLYTSIDNIQDHIIPSTIEGFMRRVGNVNSIIDLNAKLVDITAKQLKLNRAKFNSGMDDVQIIHFSITINGVSDYRFKPIESYILIDEFEKQTGLIGIDLKFDRKPEYGDVLHGTIKAQGGTIYNFKYDGNNVNFTETVQHNDLEFDAQLAREDINDIVNWLTSKNANRLIESINNLPSAENKEVAVKRIMNSLKTLAVSELELKEKLDKLKQKDTGCESYLKQALLMYWAGI